MSSIRIEGPISSVKELAEVLRLTKGVKRSSYKERNTGVAHLYVDLDDAAVRRSSPESKAATGRRPTLARYRPAKWVIEAEPSPRQLPPQLAATGFW